MVALASTTALEEELALNMVATRLKICYYCFHSMQRSPRAWAEKAVWTAGCQHQAISGGAGWAPRSGFGMASALAL